MSSSRTSGRDVFTIIVQEHRLVEQQHKELSQLYNNNNSNSSSNNNLITLNKELLQRSYMLIRDLSIHAHKEQILVYPLFNRIPNSSELLQHALAEHSEVEKQLFALEQQCMKYEGELVNNSNSIGNQPFPTEIITVINSFMADVQHHVEDEESSLLPKLAAVVPADESILLGRQWESLNAQIASRPHPSTGFTIGELCLSTNIAQSKSDQLVDESRFKHSIPTAPGAVTKDMTDIQLKAETPLEQQQQQPPQLQEQFIKVSEIQQQQQQQQQSSMDPELTKMGDRF